MPVIPGEIQSPGYSGVCVYVYAEGDGGKGQGKSLGKLSVTGSSYMDVE